MFVLIWVTLLFAVRRNDANEVASPRETLQLSAETGLCVVIPCYFTTDPGFDLRNAAWYKCEQNCSDSDVILYLNGTNPEAQSGFEGRASLLEPDLSQRNCSIIISGLTKSDSGSYQLISVLNGTTEGNVSQRANITVNDLTQKPTVMIPPLTEGQQTTLTCTAPGLCSGSAPEITWTWSGARENDSHITGNITDNQRHSSTLTFKPSAMHHGTNVTCKVSFTNNITTEETVTLNVTYVKKPQITGKMTLKEGDTLNLTCSVDSFPPSVITWTKLIMSKNLNNETGGDAATLVIYNVRAEHSGQYVCSAKHLNQTLREEVNVTVTGKYQYQYPKVLNSSGCINRSGVLTCTCISEGFPLPIITWPLLKNHTMYSVITTKSNHTVNSTVILSVKDQSNTVVECVSSNKNGEVKANLIINKVKQEEEKGEKMKMLRAVTSLEVVIAFLIGALLSAIVCCLVRKCHRKKQRTYGNLAETVEMVTSQEDPLIDAGPAVEDDQAVDREAAEGEGAVAAGKDVEYSNLDFSRVKRKIPAEAGTTQETTETDYAEIKKGEAEERLDEEGKEEEEDYEERKHCVQEEGEDMALYSNVKDILG